MVSMLLSRLLFSAEQTALWFGWFCLILVYCVCVRGYNSFDAHNNRLNVWGLVLENVFLRSIPRLL